MLLVLEMEEVHRRIAREDEEMDSLLKQHVPVNTIELHSGYLLPFPR